MTNFYNIVKDMTNEDLDNLFEAIKTRRTTIAYSKKGSFKVGDTVKFIHKNKYYEGEITDIGRTKATVRMNFTRYSVPMNMLEIK